MKIAPSDTLPTCPNLTVAGAGVGVAAVVPDALAAGTGCGFGPQAASANTETRVRRTKVFTALATPGVVGRSVPAVTMAAPRARPQAGVRRDRRRGLVGLALVAGLQGLLADEIECLEHWAVAEREQHCLATVGGMLVPRPRRHDERVAFGPVEAFPADDAVPAALGHVIDGARGVAVRLGVLARADELQVRAHRRQRRTSGVRIDVLEHDPVERAAGVIAKSLQRGATVVPAVIEDRRELAHMTLVRRTEVLCPAVA